MSNAVTLWTGTYGLCAMKHGDGDADYVQYGDVPSLWYRQTHYKSRHLELPYKDEQSEYCRVTV